MTQDGWFLSLLCVNHEIKIHKLWNMCIFMQARDNLQLAVH